MTKCYGIGVDRGLAKIPFNDKYEEDVVLQPVKGVSQEGPYHPIFLNKEEAERYIFDCQFPCIHRIVEFELK